jgi:hypothetical protein
VVDKQRRRVEREARERQLAARERRARRLRLTGAVALAAVALAGLGALTTLGDSVSERLPAGSSSPFGQHFDGLEVAPRRRRCVHDGRAERQRTHAPAPRGLGERRARARPGR